MGRKDKKTYTQVVSLKLSIEQEQWLLRKATAQTEKLDREVTKTMVIRALIQQQMDKDAELAQVWNDSIQVSGAV